MEKTNKVEGLLKKDGEEEIPKGIINKEIEDKECEIQRVVLELAQDAKIYNSESTFNLLKKSQPFSQTENNGCLLYSKITQQIYSMDENEKSNVTVNLANLIKFVENKKEDKMFPVIFKIIVIYKKLFCWIPY